MVVMIILAAIAIRVSRSGINMTDKTKIQTEMQELETAIVNRFSNYLLNEDAFPLIGDSITVTEAINMIRNSNLSYDTEKLNAMLTEDIEYVRKLNDTQVKKLGIQNITGSTYIVDYKNARVYGPIQ